MRPWLSLLLPAALAALPAAQVMSPPVPSGIDWQPELGARVDPGLAFTDHDGRRVELGELLRGRPVVLALVYYRCPMLCNLVLEGLVRALRVLAFDAGVEYDLIVLSIDPREAPELAARKRAACLEEYGRDGAGWTFLVGEEPSIAALADAVGYRFSYAAATGEYAHPAGVAVLAPDGRLSQVLYGADFAPRDLRFALIEAAHGAIGTPLDKLLLRCFHYDPARGRYGLAILAGMRAAGILTVVVLAGLVGRALLRERRRRGARERACAG